MRTNKEIIIDRRYYKLTVPKGSAVEYSKDCQCYFLTPAKWMGWDEHDARHYGFRVKKEDIDFGEHPETDHTDDICPCGDVDCSRPFGHEEVKDGN